MNLKILNIEPGHWSETAIKKLSALGQVTEMTVSQEELEKIIPEFDVLLFSVGYKINRQLIDKAKRFKLVACAATGIEHVDLEYLKERGIGFLSLKGQTELLKKVTSTAELAFGLLLALLRKLPGNFDSVKSDRWERDRFKGRQLSGKVFGILGYGRLGQIAAKIARGFDMEVIVSDPYVKATGFRQVSAPELYRDSDVVSIHVALTPETTRMIGERELKMMKPQAVLINTARGQVIDESALLKALEGGWIAGAGLDVLEEEPTVEAGFTSTHSLVQYAKTHDNLIISSHIGGMTYEAAYVTRDWLTDRVLEFFKK